MSNKMGIYSMVIGHGKLDFSFFETAEGETYGELTLNGELLEGGWYTGVHGAFTALIVAMENHNIDLQYIKELTTEMIRERHYHN